MSVHLPNPSTSDTEVPSNTFLTSPPDQNGNCAGLTEGRTVLLVTATEKQYFFRLETIPTDQTNLTYRFYITVGAF